MRRIKKTWNPYRHRKFAEDFFERGGIYGRSKQPPWRAYRIKRVFRTAIHYRDHAFDASERWATANNTAFNSQPMHVVFAYQWRPKPWTPIPQGGGEYRCGGDAEHGGTLVFDFKLTLPKAA